MVLILSAALISALTLAPQIAQAYVGPGIGISFIGTLIFLVVGVIFSIASLVAWPIYVLKKKKSEQLAAKQKQKATRKKPATKKPTAKKATAKKKSSAKKPAAKRKTTTKPKTAPKKASPKKKSVSKKPATKKAASTKAKKKTTSQARNSRKK